MVSKPVLVLSLFGLALWAGCSSPGAGSTGAHVALPPVRPSGGSASKYISNVIVVIQENRSFENFFAGWPGANAPMSGCASPSPEPSGNAVAMPAPQYERPAASVSCPPNDSVVALHQATFQTNADLEHDWGSSMKEWNKGQMDGFSAYGNNHGPHRAYAYIEHAQIEPYRLMARQYVLADAMFPTEFGGSFTAHLTLVAGTDDIKLPSEAEVNFPSHAPDDCDSQPGTKSSYLTPNRVIHFFDGPFPCFDQFNTIAQVLDTAQVSWKMYATQLVDGGFWEPFEAIRYVRYGSDWRHDIIAPQTKFLTDASSGKLASVSWVTPTRTDSDHPHYLSDKGPSWVASIVNAVGTSQYWSKSAIIVVWDDWGGFYDNAPPPQLDYRGLGMRVPCLIISPYAKHGVVDHTQYEYGSILRFIEEVNGLPPGSIGATPDGYTDARAKSLDSAFDFTQQPRKFKMIPSKYPMSHFIHEPPDNQPTDTE